MKYAYDHPPVIMCFSSPSMNISSPGKIKDLLVEGMVDDSSRLVVVNAIYFKGLWENKFKEEFTEDGQFKMNKVTASETALWSYQGVWHRFLRYVAHPEK